MNREHLLKVLIRILEEQTGERLGPDKYDVDLTALGVDSLAAIEVAHQLEEALNLTIDDREVLGFRTVNAICATLERGATFDSPVANEVP